MGVEEFRDRGDDGYLRWIDAHHHGYVINIQRSHNPRDARLHTAICQTITGTPARGSAFVGDWVKVCSASLAELDDWAMRETGSALQRCPVCQPPQPQDGEGTSQTRDRPRWGVRRSAVRGRHRKRLRGSLNGPRQWCCHGLAGNGQPERGEQAGVEVGISFAFPTLANARSARCRSPTRGWRPAPATRCGRPAGCSGSRFSPLSSPPTQLCLAGDVHARAQVRAHRRCRGARRADPALLGPSRAEALAGGPQPS